MGYGTEDGEWSTNREKGRKHSEEPTSKQQQLANTNFKTKSINIPYKFYTQFAQVF